MQTTRNVRALVSIIFDSQKRIILNQIFLREIVLSGVEPIDIKQEHINLKLRIKACQKVLFNRSKALNSV